MARVVLEAAGQLVPRPLRPFEQEDRIRAVLGLTSDDPLPQAGVEQLPRYAESLREKLSFPFRADIWVQLGPFSGEVRPVTAHRLLDLSERGGREGDRPAGRNLLGGRAPGRAAVRPGDR